MVFVLQRYFHYLISLFYLVYFQFCLLEFLKSKCVFSWKLFEAKVEKNSGGGQVFNAILIIFCRFLGSERRKNWASQVQRVMRGIRSPKILATWWKPTWHVFFVLKRLRFVDKALKPLRFTFIQFWNRKNRTKNLRLQKIASATGLSSRREVL